VTGPTLLELQGEGVRVVALLADVSRRDVRGAAIVLVAGVLVPAFATVPNCVAAAAK